MSEVDSASGLEPSFASFDRATGPGDDSPASELREGLPKTYRPRHDLHYVEHLTAAVLSEVALARFFDAGWSERPGGSSAELAILLARQAATLHRARLEVSSAAGAGTTVTMTFDT